MTGNIKRTMLAFGEYVRTKHTAFLMEGLIFVSLLVSFVLGVVFSAYLTIIFSEKTIFRCPRHDEYFLSKYGFIFFAKKSDKRLNFE